MLSSAKIIPAAYRKRAISEKIGGGPTLDLPLETLSLKPRLIATLFFFFLLRKAIDNLYLKQQTLKFN